MISIETEIALLVHIIIKLSCLNLTITLQRLLEMIGNNGNLYMCNISVNIRGVIGWPDDHTIDLTSDPLHVCDCSTENNIMLFATYRQ